MLERMQKLRQFVLDDDDDCRINDIICKVVDFAISQDKKVEFTIKKFRTENRYRKLIIKGKNDDNYKFGDDQQETLNVLLSSAFHSMDQLFKIVNEYLILNRKEYRAFIC